MAEASRVLASSMDYDETLAQIARLAVPQIADWCAVDVARPRTARSSAWPSTMPTRAGSRWRRGWIAATRPAPDEPVGVAEVIRTGRARIYDATSTPGALAAYARDSEHLELLQAIGATAVIIVPLAAPTRPRRRDHARLRGLRAAA